MNVRGRPSSKALDVRPIFPIRPDRCRPIRIVADGKAPSDGLLGGWSPEGIAPTRRLSYFATIPIGAERDLHVSLFVASLEVLMAVHGRVNEDGPLEAVTHPRLPRGSESEHGSPLSSHDLEILPEEDDLVPDEEGTFVVRSDHKIGGQPYLIRATDRLTTALDECRRAGFVHLIQIDFPGAEDALVSGNWPFADGVLGLLGRPPFTAGCWRWWWDF